MPGLKPADLELLSAYLDDALPAADRTTLESRLAADPALRAELEALRGVVQRVRALPVLKAPRDFRLDPAIYGKPVVYARPAAVTAPRRATLSRAYYRWGSAISAVAAAVMLLIGVLGLLGSPLRDLASGTLQDAAPAPVALAPTDQPEAALRSAENEVAAPAAEMVLPTGTPLVEEAAPLVGMAEADEVAGVQAFSAEAPTDAAASGLAAPPAAMVPRGMGGGMDGIPTKEILPTPATALQAPGVEGAALAAGQAAAAESVESTGALLDNAAETAATKSGPPTPMLMATEIAIQPTAAAAQTREMVEAPAEAAESITATRADESTPVNSGVFLGIGAGLLALAGALLALSRRA